MATLIGLLKFLMWILTVNSAYAHEHEKLLKRAIHSVDFFKLKLHQKLETDRLRRSLNMNDESYLQRLPNILTRKVHLPAKSFELLRVWLPVKVNESEKVFAVIGDNVVTYLEDFSSTSSYLFPSQNIYALQAFQDGISVWLVSLYWNEWGHHFMQLHQYADQIPIPRQMERLLGSSFLTIVTVKRSTYLLLLSNTDSICLLKLFLWSGTQFVFLAKETFTKRCSALQAWNMNIELYIAVGFEGKNMAKVLVYNKAGGNILSIQNLGSCHVIQHFGVLGNHHLICGTEKASLYWWNDSKFMKLQEFTNSKALSDAAVFSLSPESVVLVLGWKDKIEFLMQDLSSRYIKFGNINLAKDETLKSLEMWEKAPILFLLPVFEGVHPTIVYELHMNFNSRMQKNELHALKNCTSLMNLKLNANTKNMDELSSKMNDVWTMKKHASISSFFVNGSVTSKMVKAQKISVLSAGGQANKLSGYKILSIRLKKLLFAMQNLLARVMLKTGNQKLKSNINFTRPITAFQGQIKNLSKEVSLNEVKSSVIPSCLKTNGQQKISSPISVDTLVVGNMAAFSINNKQVENLLILNKSTDIEGHLTLPHTVVKDVIVSGRVNDLKISELVLSSKIQSVYGMKSFVAVTANSFTAKQINGVNVSNMKTAALLTKESIDHNLNFTSKLVLHNANVTMKGFDFPYLLTKVVTKDKDEIIKGPKSVKNSIVVKNSLNITGLLNKINISNLMLKYVPQIIHGSFMFSNASFQEIASDSVNNLDLSTICVRKSATNTIKGKVKFSESLNVSNVLLRENVLLDHVDPSKAAYGMKSCCDLISNASFEIGNAVVKGNVTIREEELFPFFRLKSKVWLKSVPQNISYGKFKKISVGEMKVNLTNGIEIQDIVPVDGDAIIDSMKWFENNLSVRRIDMVKGKKIILSMKLLSEETILQVLGDINMPYMSVNGNLSISSFINNISISDIMTVYGRQVCNSSKVFQTAKMKGLNAGNISFKFYNKADFGKTFGDSVVLPPTKMIKNKWFQNLIGKDLDVAGLLGGKNCTHDFQNFVTLNSYQGIPAHHLFINLTAETLVARNLDKILKMVVCKDETKYITSNKTFKKGLFTKTMDGLGEINQINVTALQANAFMKDGQNVLKRRVKFLSDLPMNKLYINKYSAMDGVSLDDFILVAENGTLEAFNASSLMVGNVTINGCFSACCLKLVFENALSFPKDLQNILHFKNLEINGGVTFSPGILSDLFNDSSMSSDFYGNFVFGDIRSGSVQVLGAVNDGIDLDFMLVDGVNHKTPQKIPAKKIFSYLKSTNTSVAELTVKTIFNETAEQFFGFNKKWENTTLVNWRNLPHLFAKNVTIHGTINNVNLPEDVVLTESDEVIYTDVSMNATMNMTSGIQITGSLSGIKLDFFLKGRTSLSTEETISSKINFVNDSFVKRYLETIKINNVSLGDVLRTQEGRDLSGAKIFQNVSFSSDLTVQKHFNGFNLSSLISSMAKISEAEIIEMIIFDALNVTDLSNTSVNGISADKLCDEMHGVDFEAASFLRNLTEKMNNVTEDLSLQKEESDNEFTVFEFFTLHQVLKPHHTQRFLPVFEPGTFGEEWERSTLQMVVWAEKNNSGCRNVQSYAMNVLEDGTLTFKKKLKGRVYPFALKMQQQEITGFWVHEEKSSCKASGKNNKLIINTVWSASDVQKNEVVVPVDASLLDVKLFEEEEVYLMVFFKSEVLEEKIYIYEYDAVNNSWSIHQKFHSNVPSAYDLISLDDGQFPFRLAVASEPPNSSVSVYAWVEKKFELFVQHAKPAISAVLWVQKEKELCLMMARANTTLSKENGQVQTSLETLEVFALVDDLVLDHTVSIHSIHELKMFTLDGEIFVLACSRHLQVVYILQLRGQNGFQIVQEIPAPGVTGAVIFTTEEDQVILAISSDTGHTRILKAAIVGNRFPED